MTKAEKVGDEVKKPESKFIVIWARFYLHVSITASTDFLKLG